MKRIKLLSADIASQIAAGEVIERPASVLKELLENSIDAGATKIDITIQRGGTQLIEVRDNGSGILKQDLELALQQHATSKISSAADLSGITSLGFRGEALASINSVAKLSIISQTAEQEQAWSISSDGLKPAAHPIGTTISMRDLFHNIPARRKFLRSEGTEYQHLEEVFRRIALSNFAVGFSLSNHDKLVKNLPVCRDHAARTRRLVTLCGQQVMEHSVTIDGEQNGLRLWGWLGSALHARSQEPHQYFFINQRVIRDRLINHAIRQVYQPLCLDGKMPFYCLNLELDPVALDVNVHPTKHEVRFRDSRIIHSFLSQTLLETLQITGECDTIETKPITFDNNFVNNTQAYNSGSGEQIIGIIDNRIVLANRHNKLIMLDLVAARRQLLLQELQTNLIGELLEPALTTKFSHTLTYDVKFEQWCETFAVKLDQSGENSLIVRSLPVVLHKQNLDLQLLIAGLYNAWINSATQDAVLQAMVSSVDLTASVSIVAAQELMLRVGTSLPEKFWREFSATQLSEMI